MCSPYVKSQKTDDRDAEAIAEAATRPTMRLVTLKSEAQLDLQVLHWARERLVTARTRLINQLRAVLLERGVILPKRRAPLRHRLHELVAGELPISPRVMRLLQDLRDEWARIGAWIRQLLTRAHPNVVVVALAAKLVRIVWAVLRHGHAFEHQAPAMS